VTDSLGKPAVMPVSRVGAREASLVDEATEPVALSEVDEATDPVALSEADEAPPRQDDIAQESTEAAADEEGGRTFAHRIRSRAVWLPLACVAALLVGFGSMNGPAQARRRACTVGHQAGADDSGARRAAAVRRCPRRHDATSLDDKPLRGRERAATARSGVGAARLSAGADRNNAAAEPEPSWARAPRTE
jgi:hypothetical protein